MGERKRSTAHFLRRHATQQGADRAACVFCGGSGLATERDHIPARSLFRNRQWPEGYEFPACSSCNDASQADEQLLSLIVRLRPDDENVDAEERRRAIAGVANNHGDLIDSLELSNHVKRRALRRLGIAPPLGVNVRSIPLISLSDRRWYAAVNRYSEKLARALYYFHSRKIAAMSSEFTVKWIAPLSDRDGDRAEAFAQLIGGLAIPMRSGRSLDQQFVYRYGIGESDPIAAFLILFSPTLCLLIVLDGREPAERQLIDVPLAM